jgi:hypothetical protein
MASHQNIPERAELTEYALKSIAKGTSKPDKVLISYSGHRINEDSWSAILQDIPHVILYSDKPLLQFDHYERLGRYVSDDDIVMFCDDDDLYHPDKVLKTREHMKREKCDIFIHGYAKFHITQAEIDQGKMIDSYEDIVYNKEVLPCSGLVIEYTAQAVKGRIFKSFFPISDELRERHGKFIDLHFGLWLKKQGKIFELAKILYYYRFWRHLSIFTYEKLEEMKRDA